MQLKNAATKNAWASQIPFHHPHHQALSFFPSLTSISKVNHVQSTTSKIPHLHELLSQKDQNVMNIPDTRVRIHGLE